MIFSRRYALTSGFYPTAYGKTGKATWKSHSYGHASGLLKVQGVDWDGKPNFNRTYPIRGSQVWYQHANLKQAERNFTQQINEESNVVLNLAKGAVMSSATGIPLSGRMLFDKRFKNAINPDDSAVSKVFHGLFQEYRTKASFYTRQYQRELVSGLNKISLDDVKIERLANQRTIEVRAEAHRSRAAFEEQASPEEAPGKSIGATQPMDAFIKIGNRIVGVDVTQELGISSAEQSRSRHHSLTEGALMSEAEYQNSTDEQIRKKMKGYYNNAIQSQWNPAIANLRTLTQETTGKKQVTAAEMRNPTGGLHGKRGPPQPSLPVDTAANDSRIISQELGFHHRKAIVAHLFHWIGNWSATSAGSYDTFTLEHKPKHRTAAAFLRNYAASNKSRAFEFKNVRDTDVHVFDGPALFNLARMQGYYTDRTVNQFVGDTTATQLVARGFGGRGRKAVVNGSNLAINGRGRPRVVMDMFIPPLEHKHTNEILERLAEGVTDNVANKFHEETQNDRLKGKSPHMFSNYLKGYGKQLAKQLGTVDPNYTFWASPFYGTEFVGDTRKNR